MGVLYGCVRNWAYIYIYIYIYEGMDLKGNGWLKERICDKYKFELKFPHLSPQQRHILMGSSRLISLTRTIMKGLLATLGSITVVHSFRVVVPL